MSCPSLRVRRLYSVPELFDPVSFTDGVNLILGDKSEGSDKTNGVGKSLMIEFLNFALLKELRYSRVRRIPSHVFPPDALICLDFEIDGRPLTLQRSVNAAETPTLLDGDSKVAFACLDDAKKYLWTILSEGVDVISPPSFRDLMGTLIRDESSEFKSIVKCYDTDLRIPPNYAVHLYFFGIDSKPYRDAQRLYDEMERYGVAIRKAAEDIKMITGRTVGEAKADLNELKNQVQRIQRDLDRLGTCEGYEIVRDEVASLEAQLARSRSQQAALKLELAKVSLFSGDQYINAEEVGELYDLFRAGLGDAIRRDIEEVTRFKKKIDDFERSLVQERKATISEELKRVDREVSGVDQRYRERLEVLDQHGELKSLRISIAAQQKKADDQARLAAFVEKHSEYERQKADLRSERENAIYLLRSLVHDARGTIAAFEETLLEIHERVAGNKLSSFEIKVSAKKEILEFDMRISDDGSHSVEREKVFMYDITLLMSDATSCRHPGFLVHDNIFDVDQDTLVRSLNYLGDHLGVMSGRQYILTINSDKFSERDRDHLRLNVDALARATYTKQRKFLRTDYQQVK